MSKVCIVFLKTTGKKIMVLKTKYNRKFMTLIFKNYNDKLCPLCDRTRKNIP